MEIAFDSRQMRSLFESQKALNRKFGVVVAESLMTLFSELRAASSIDDLIHYDISKKMHSAIEITLEAGVRLVLEANHAKPPKDSEASINWSDVYMIKVTDIHHVG
ncbi:hypothetical protein [Brucella pseudogrignonensis]|uniref:hypothetical protein n=1 Tax=Brucella pseudogrignonensis TaxID=419475 RepID=UPI003D96BFAD